MRPWSGALRLLPLIALGVIVATPPAAAVPSAAGVAVARQARAANGLDAAVARIQRETGGRVLSAEQVRERGRTVYRIKVLMPSGRVRVFHVPADGDGRS